MIFSLPGTLLSRWGFCEKFLFQMPISGKLTSLVAGRETVVENRPFSWFLLCPSLKVFSTYWSQFPMRSPQKVFQAPLQQRAADPGIHSLIPTSIGPAKRQTIFSITAHLLLAEIILSSCPLQDALFSCLWVSSISRRRKNQSLSSTLVSSSDFFRGSLQDDSIAWNQ